jgi:hypothetical protein
MHSPNGENTRNNGTTGYKKVTWADGNYYYRVVKNKNGKWAPDPHNKKWYVKTKSGFSAPKYLHIGRTNEK